MKLKLRLLTKAFLAVAAITGWSSAMAQDIVTISDDGSGTGTTTWTSDNIYHLDGFVFVNEGQTLTIEPGTVIKGLPGSGEDASALIVARGATIMAEGEPNNPIIFTYEDDPLDGSIDPYTKGQWGGVIVLGAAGLNSSPGTSQIEGIPTSEPRGEYGGTDDMDDSGVIRYVSIRHGGSNIGANNEINGLTLGGVGSETTIEYVEVFSNQDDGIEWFGGTANVKYAAVHFCGDDAYDYDEGWRGKAQYLFTVQQPNVEDAGNGGEHDGGTDPETGTPYAMPTIYNATYIGNGNENLITLRDNAGGFYWNSIFANFQNGVDIENLSSGEDSYSRYQAGDLALAGNLFFDVVMDGTDATAEDLFVISMGEGGWESDADSLQILNDSSTDLQSSFDGNNNVVADPGACFTYSNIAVFSEDLYPVPNANTEAPSSAPDDDFFDPISYRGAFDPSQDATWLEEWTALDYYGFLGSECNVGQEEVVVNRESLEVFPNPSNGVINIRINENMQDVTIEVFDVVGKRIAAKEGVNMNAGTMATFSLEDAEPGIYVVSLKHGNTIDTAKVIKR